ncbi:gamma-glutamyltransferase family protein [Halobacillus shinanisalinarum]|uniref:Gamma-glutamyltransferase family protein n=1 Tax=Halobacillus shinanisalinarum TaxID=2932258 RepID=A0ABY4GUX2_9BACI|nr:gamma-glutamyltransferase family protein [Halobacillus shinanisalinarum]UOQ91756.1 gamma-glutamyltransferase family protein [Halobacillus shinanisalinarum]
MLYNPYPSTRLTTYGTKGMVATSQPLAAQAGLDILKKGGNAVDAAIATAACLTVVEPTSNGIGGDAFALVWMKDHLYGLNASGPAPQSISINAVKEKGYKSMPTHGFIPVTVPGAPAAWAELSDKFGKLDFKELLAPAIAHAEEGYALTPILAKYWEKAYNQYKEKLTDELFSNWFETFAPNGRAPKVGEIWSSSDHAKTLRELAETKSESLYNGHLADQIDSYSRKHGGFLRKQDLQRYKSKWVEPISVNYRGYDVWEAPPNGQGLVALMGLNMTKRFQFESTLNMEDYHRQIEALKLAYSDGHKHIAEKGNMKYSVDDLLSDNYGEKRANQIGDEAVLPKASEPSSGGTVYLATGDAEGNMVSFIQSNYEGFGSGLVVPGTGIALQNRGHNFSMNPKHVNALEGGKRSFHTIIPGFLTKDSKPVGPFGVMGGFMQPQGHMQVVSHLIDCQLNPQMVLDAPRWQWTKEKEVLIEPDFPNHIAQGLERKGHHIRVELDTGRFGRGQIILRNNETGVLAGGTESRTDGTIAVW